MKFSQIRNMGSESANLRFAKCADLRILDPHNFANLRILRIIFVNYANLRFASHANLRICRFAFSALDANLADLRFARFANLRISRFAD